MNTKTHQFVVRLLLEKGPLPQEQSIADYRYLDTGHIDSLAFIKFIFKIEEEFKIQFQGSELGSKEIRTLGGLCRLIADKTGKS